ncbi:hypothetical protein I6F11_29405 [Ensifer sp. NBAIM29]|nr:hypothetical protein [Ensifer sp. NBAIM29]
MATLEELEEARSELARWTERLDNYSGNNPNKYRADINAARQRVRELEDDLKAAGALPRSAQEQLESELDRAFPNAKSKEIVEYRGRKYLRRFWPLERSNSGKTVTQWGKGWELVDDT